MDTNLETDAFLIRSKTNQKKKYDNITVKDV